MNVILIVVVCLLVLFLLGIINAMICTVFRMPSPPKLRQWDWLMVFLLVILEALLIYCSYCQVKVLLFQTT